LELPAVLRVSAEMELRMQAAEAGVEARNRAVEARNKETIRASFQAWREGKGRVFDLLAADAKWTAVGNSPIAGTYHSRQQFLDEVINPFNARLSSRLIPTVRGIYADGDMVVALFDGEGTALDGKPYRNTYSWFMRMRDGQIYEVVGCFDTVAYTDFWTRVTPTQDSRSESSMP
jgi:ketosteroid isomerase-like protein